MVRILIGKWNGRETETGKTKNKKVDYANEKKKQMENAQERRTENSQEKLEKL